MLFDRLAALSLSLSLSVAALIATLNNDVPSQRLAALALLIKTFRSSSVVVELVS